MKLKLIHDSELTPLVFKKHPVWAEYYEPEDATRMIKDGFLFDDVESELERIEFSDSYLIPVRSIEKPSPYQFTLYQATVEVAGTYTFDGYIFVIKKEVISFAIYNNSEWHIINFNYLDEEERKEVCCCLGVKDLFPLHVESKAYFDFKKNYDKCP